MRQERPADYKRSTTATELAQLDRDMNTAFQEALARLPGAKAKALRQEQRAFIANRDRMFGRPSYQLKQEMRRRKLEISALVPDDGC